MKRILAALILLSLNLIAQDELTLLTTIHGVQSVEALGDVNGDGYNDFVAGGSKGTKLYFGGSPFDTNNCYKFKANGSNTSFNKVYAGRGDLNGDGHPDIVLGANYGLFESGKVFIYFGGEEIDTTAGLTIAGQGYYYKFGYDISINGDVNGDGYDDLVVSAPQDDYDARGRVYIYFGGEEMDTESDVYLEGEEEFDMFGWSLSTAGDVNGDGYDDFVIGAPQNLISGAGKAYLFFGGDSIGFDNSVVFKGGEDGYYYGQIVSDIGNINGDGFADFGIAAVDSVIDVFSGKLQDKLFTIASEKNYWSTLDISNGFDLNSDGNSDFIISYAHQEDQYAGGIAIYLGGDELDTVAAYSLDGTTPKGYFGEYLAIPGDINNDGYCEVLVGTSTEGSGTVRIYSFNKPTSVKESSLPTEIQLSNNYPNPFNPTTVITFTLPKSDNVKLIVYDILGREVIKLADGAYEAGEYKFQFEASDLASGVYIYRLQTTSTTLTKKMMLLK